jgi:hypothetical protein
VYKRQGLFTVLLNQYIHKPVEAFVLSMPQVIAWTAVIVISVIFLCDAVVSVKVALGIRDMLDAKVRFKKEFEEASEQFSRRLLELKEALSESFGDRVAEFGKNPATERLNALADVAGERLSALADSAGERLNALIDAANERLNALAKLSSEKEKEEIHTLSKLGERLKSLKRENESQTERMAYLKLKMFRRNPTATSRKFEKEFSNMREEQLRWYEKRRREKRKRK